MVFVADRTGIPDLFVMSKAGGTATQITFAAYASRPTVSKNGSKILFGCRADICIVDADGSNLTHLTTSGMESMPAWSWDETRIAFTSRRDGNLEIYAMSSDGSNPIRLTNDPAQDLGPNWSPNGAHLVFDSDRNDPGGDFQVYIMDANGMNPTPLISGNGSSYDAVWSHSGAKLAFGSSRNGTNQLFIANADGSQQIALVRSPAANPAWAFDDQQIAFTDLARQHTTVAVVRSDGLDVRVLTDSQVTSREPTFSP